MARRRVAMEVDTSGWFEHAVEFGEALGHHREVGHHVVLAEELAHGLEQLGQLVGAVGDDLLVGALGVEGPVPGVVEGGDLRRRILAGALLEQHVVGGVGVEGRVEIDEVDGL